MAQKTSLNDSMQRLEALISALEEDKAHKPQTLAGEVESRLVNLQQENATLRKRHESINSRLTRLIGSLEQQLEG